MRAIVLAIFVGAFAYTPFYALDHFVLPQLDALQHSYQAAAETAAAIAGDE